MNISCSILVQKKLNSPTWNNTIINFDLIIRTFEIKANIISKIIKATQWVIKVWTQKKISIGILNDRLINNSVPMIQQYKPYGVL